MIFSRRIDFKGIAFCVVMATVIWFFHALNKTYQTKIKYPLDLTVKQNNVISIIPEPEFIELNVIGEGWAILRTQLGIGLEPIHLEVKNPTNVKHLALNSLLGVLQKNLVNLKIHSFVNDSLDLHYEYITSKDVYIKLHQPDIPLRENYRITSHIHIEPSVITFNGASSMVQKISDTLFITLKDTDIARDYNRTVRIAAPEHLNLTPNRKEVNVSFTVAPFVTNSKILPLTIIHFPKDSSAYITEDSAIIQYAIPENLPDRLMPDTMHIYLDYYELNYADSTIKPYMNKLPDFIADPVVYPSKFKLKYRQKK
jgi:hypothetical protein